MPFSNFTNPYQNPADVSEKYRRNLQKLFKADGSYVRQSEDPVTLWAIDLLVEEYGVPMEAMELELYADLKGQIRNLQIPNNAVSYIDKPSIQALRLPLPPRSIQDHIAQVMQDAYAKAKLLRTEADDLVAEAKVRVERMILGEEDVA